MGQINFMRHFPLLQRLALKLPASLGKVITPGYIEFRSVRAIYSQWLVTLFMVW